MSLIDVATNNNFLFWVGAASGLIMILDILFTLDDKKKGDKPIRYTDCGRLLLLAYIGVYSLCVVITGLIFFLMHLFN